jgi:hypothetical protein
MVESQDDEKRWAGDAEMQSDHDSQRSQRSQPQTNDVPDIKRLTSLRPGSKGRNFECFTGLLEDDQEEPKKVLVKLYKRQQAKIDEAENQKQVYSVVNHPNVI